MNTVLQTKAYNALLEISASVRQTACGLPAQTHLKRLWSGIGFMLFNRHFVAPMSDVSELLEVPPYTRLPGVQAWVLGMANVRGRLLPLIDLAAFLGGRQETSRRHHRILVIETGDSYSGLVVDHVLGMLHFSVDRYVPEMTAGEHSTMLPYLQGLFRDDSDHDWAVFSPVALVCDARFSRPEFSSVDSSANCA